jgi:hypothetical protein
MVKRKRHQGKLKRYFPSKVPINGICSKSKITIESSKIKGSLLTFSGLTKEKYPSVKLIQVFSRKCYGANKALLLCEHFVPQHLGLSK